MPVLLLMFLISTHTPAKGVTNWFDDLDGGLEISTHTPAKGVTYVP